MYHHRAVLKHCNPLSLHLPCLHVTLLQALQYAEMYATSLLLIYKLIEAGT